MCGGPEHYRPNLRRDADIMAFDISLKNLQLGQAETSLLELAADNDLKSFRHVIEQDSGRVNEVGNWYGRRIGCNKMGLEQRTPLMIAALYGSVEVVEYILSLPKTLSVLVNQTCGSDGCTALHCAAAGAAIKALQVVKLLLEHGADKTAMDSLGRRPADVICVPPNYPAVKVSMELALCNGNMGNWISATTPANAFGETSRRQVEAVEDAPFSHPSRNVTDADSLKEDFLGDGGDIFPLSPSPSLSSSPDSWSSPSGSPCIPSSPKGLECSQSAKPSDDLVGKLHESPLEVPIPDIKNSIYTTDEFRMFSFKVRPCSRAYSHDWTECPFVHPGENARRRDPRRYHYSCVPCPDFRKGACRRGDACEYAHGVFECWLHPAQYRTRLCKDGTSCARRVCFFAHTAEELRPLYVSTNSAIPSPRASSSFDARSMSPPLPSPLSPIGAASPFSPSSTSMNGLTVNGMATPPLSPSSHGGAWAQANVPSRLRTTVSARDIPLDEQDFDGQLSDFFHGRPSHAIISGSTAAAAARMEKYGSLGLSIPPINLEDMFASEVVSALSVSQLTSQDHSHVSPQLHSQLQSDMLSPISAHTFLHAASQNQLQNHSAMQGTVFGIGSPRPNSPVIDMPNCVLPTDITSELQARRLAFAQRASWSSREFAGSVSPGSWSDWGSPSGKPDWGVQGHDLSKFRKSASFASHGVEPDLSWVQKLVKETPNDTGLNHLKE